MATLLDKLPTILVLAVLVGIFLVLRRHAPSARVRLWTIAWALIFLHFFIQAFETHTGTIENIIESIDLGALELSGIVFLVSMTLAAEHAAKRSALLAVIGMPTAFHALAATFNWPMPRTMAAALGLAFLGGAAISVFMPPKAERFGIAVSILLSAAGIWAMKDQLRGSPDFGINALLTLTFGLCGILFWRRYPRYSPGVMVVSFGFLTWGAVFPAGALLDHFVPALKVNPELWNVPKFFVAFGMVLTMLEDKSRIIEQSSAREHAENRLLQRLSDVTSRLLAGKDPAALCSEITVAITSASSFERAALFLGGENHSVHLAASNGFAPEEIAGLQERAGHFDVAKLTGARAEDARIGRNSFRYLEGEVAIPLITRRGSNLGCLVLSGSRNPAGPDPSEMVKLEVLASDLAVTIENTRLHHQLVRSEKLAALGQLVAGVAHELNNPLTGVIGYTDLLTEEIHNDKALKRVHKLGHEARRMKRIVDGLLRFARQNNPAARAADLEAALRDVVQLREYHLRKFAIAVDVQIDPDLPRVLLGEDELKQVLLNILNNAIDAVEESAARSIRIHAMRHDDRVVIQFEDSGPGFTDPNRAFDPFYTTKPVGKGTGLGLSICYGITQECGGEITLANHQPYGARVSVELPFASTTSPIPIHA